jgi:pimeloyl-ACP methyl ester carboxylesterase
MQRAVYRHSGVRWPPRDHGRSTVIAPTIARASVNGVELAYQVHGTGRPLILLHGGFGSLEMFGPNVAALAAGRQVIGIDLQSHGRTPAADRPMRFETMADDVAALIAHLGHQQADVLGFSFGGAVALRTAIQHPDAVRKLVLVSTPFKRSGWHPEMVTAFDQMDAEFGERMKRTPLYEVYRGIAPRVEDWPILVAQLTGLLKLDYDWSDATRGLPMPVLIVAGDADGLPPHHAVEFFTLLGGGQRDAVWDRSGMTRHSLAILPRTTHYDIMIAPALATTIEAFLDAE